MNRLPAKQAGALEQLVALAVSCPKLLLMMDYDGTMVPIEERPENARPGSGLLRALRRAATKRQLVIAVISGRDIKDLRKILPVPGIYLAGCHGAEHFHPGGEDWLVVDPLKLAPVLAKIAGLGLECINGEAGFFLERKRTAVTLHYRQAEPSAALRVLANFITAAQRLVKESDLELRPGKKVLEIGPRAVNKGGAVQHLRRIYPDHYPIYLGDDATDEDAFTVIHGQGTGVLVSDTAQPTAACLRLQEPKEVLKFLQILSARCK